MWLSKAATTIYLCCAFALAGCTVEPLNNATTNGSLSPNANVVNLLSGSSVGPATTRVGQQVRNSLLFTMSGGTPGSSAPYAITLETSSTITNLAIQTRSIAPISAKATVSTKYFMRDSAGKIVATGRRTAIASFDKTPQSFANERASRNAENRAAKEVAQQIYLALSQSVAR